MKITIKIMKTPTTILKIQIMTITIAIIIATTIITTGLRMLLIITAIILEIQ